MQKRNRKRVIAISVIVIAALVAVVVFFQFTSIGYRMTVGSRGFSEPAPGIYIHDDFETSQAETLRFVDEARTRVSEYFGELRSSPSLIFCDDEDTLAKLGGDHDTATFAFFEARSYIVVSSEYLNIDILAHEMTHAEVHARLFKGKVGNQNLVPIWFDEGVALQNDYRDNYNEEAWIQATDHGENVIDLNDIVTASAFYSGDVAERRYRYIVSKHELDAWIERNGISSLLALLDRVNQGEDFAAVYYGNT